MSRLLQRRVCGDLIQALAPRSGEARLRAYALLANKRAFSKKSRSRVCSLRLRSARRAISHVCKCCQHCCCCCCRCPLALALAVVVVGSSRATAACNRSGKQQTLPTKTTHSRRTKTRRHFSHTHTTPPRTRQPRATAKPARRSFSVAGCERRPAARVEEGAGLTFFFVRQSAEK